MPTALNHQSANFRLVGDGDGAAFLNAERTRLTQLAGDVPHGLVVAGPLKVRLPSHTHHARSNASHHQYHQQFQQCEASQAGVCAPGAERPLHAVQVGRCWHFARLTPQL